MCGSVMPGHRTKSQSKILLSDCNERKKTFFEQIVLFVYGCGVFVFWQFYIYQFLRYGYSGVEGKRNSVFFDKVKAIISVSFSISCFFLAGPTSEAPLIHGSKKLQENRRCWSFHLPHVKRKVCEKVRIILDSQKDTIWTLYYKIFLYKHLTQITHPVSHLYFCCKGV